MSDASSATLLDAAAARTAARNAAALALASILAKGALFVWQLVLTRLLAQAGYGIYGTIGGMLSIAAAVPDFGMGMIVLRDVAQRRDLAGRALGVTLTIQPLLAALAYLGLIAAGWLLGYDETIRGLLPLAGLSLFVDVLGNMVHNQLLAREQMVIPSIIGVAHIGALIVLVGAALLGGLGMVGLYGATLAAGALRALAYWLALIQTGVRASWPVDWRLARRLAINGAPLALNAFLGLAYQHADKLITTATIGAENTALLTAAFVIVQGAIELLSTTVLVAVFPLMSRQHGDGRRDAFDFLVEKIAYFTLVVTLPLGIFTSLLASPLVALLFGPTFTRTTDVLAVLIWYGAITMVANVFAQMLTIQNRQRRTLLIRACGLALNVCLSLILLPRVGVAGAAVSSVIAELLTTALLLRQWEGAGARLRRLAPRLGRLLAAGAITAAVLLLLRSLNGVLALVVGGLIYLGAAGRLIAATPEDRDFLHAVLTAMPGGARLVGRIGGVR